MKKLLMSAMAVTVIMLSACAQKIDESKVPAAVKTSFATKYPATTAKWEKEGAKFEAGFKQNGNTMSALFEANGTMTESEMDIKVGELPAAVISYVKEHYKGKTIKEAAKITKADGSMVYEAEVNGKDLIFDTKGNYLEEVED